MAVKVYNWNPDDGFALQGDVIIRKLPKNFKFSKSNKVKGRNDGLILAEGEVTGHHHILKYFEASHFRDDAMARSLGETPEDGIISKPSLAESIPTKEATASMYIDTAAIDKLVSDNFLTTNTLAIGILEVKDGPLALQHHEHDTIMIPTGSYYVGRQREFDAEQERRVAD